MDGIAGFAAAKNLEQNDGGTFCWRFSLHCRVSAPSLSAGQRLTRR
jgi:hypothetical protein